MNTDPSANYDHRYHAGNIGDVWKHTAWLALLAAFKRSRIRVLDLHGGRGEYPLEARGGEWSAGIGRLRARYPEGLSTGSGAVDRYLAKSGSRQQYLGSPALSLAVLGRNDRLTVYEADAATAGTLRASMGRDGRVKLVCGDGWQAPESEVRDEGGEPVPQLVLIDPPYTDKADWDRTAETLHRAWRAGHVVMAWYPVKRLTRPARLHNALQTYGVPYIALDLLLTPIERTGDRMAGSGVLLVSAPASVPIELCAAAPALGTALATSQGQWSLRVAGFAPEPPR